MSPQLRALLCIAIGVSVTAYAWWSLYARGGYWSGYPILGPALVVVGIAYFIYPALNVPRAQIDKTLLPQYYVMVTVAVAAGLLDDYLISTVSGNSFFGF